MVLVLFRIDAQALRNEVDLDSVDVLNQTGNRGHQLLHDVPVNVGLKGAATHDFIEAES